MNAVNNDFHFLQFGIIMSGISFWIALSQSIQLSLEQSSKNLRGISTGIFYTVSFSVLGVAIGLSGVIIILITQLYSISEKKWLFTEVFRHFKKSIQELNFLEENNISAFVGIFSNETLNWILLGALISCFMITLGSIFIISEWNKSCAKDTKITV